MANALIAAPLLTVLLAAGLHLTGASVWAGLGVLLFGAPVVIFLAMAVSSAIADVDDRTHNGRFRGRKADKPVEADR